MASAVYSKKVGYSLGDGPGLPNSFLGWEVVQLVGLQILDLN